MKIKSSYLKLFFAIAFGWLFALPARAVCPVCVVAVGAGLSLSEYLGIDDTIAGVWIGGLIVAMIAWTINWLNKKSRKLGPKDLLNVLIVIVYYAAIIWPLSTRGFIGRANNSLWGTDKLLLGIIAGSIVFLAATLWYNNIKKRLGHAYFPFQKVVMPIGALIIFSFIFYLLTR